MKLRDYKTLLVNDNKTAMLFDLTERFPRGPTGKLRDRDYKNAQGDVLQQGWGSNTAPFLNRGVDSAEGSDKTGGWNPYDIYEMQDDEWACARMLEQIQVPVDIAMDKMTTWNCEEGNARLFKRGAQLTRRARRMANRIRRAKEWVKENIGTAVYMVSFGWRGNKGIYVHADSEVGAKKQFELFMQGAFNDHCAGWNGEDDLQIHYIRPAKTPMELMTLNASFIDEYVRSVELKREKIIQLQKEIDAMDMAQQVVNIYAINMVASWGTGEGEDTDA